MMMTHPYFNSLRPDTTKMTGLVKTACICSAITLYPFGGFCQWVLTAIHPDPTPPLGAPESEFIAMTAIGAEAADTCVTSDGWSLDWNGVPRLCAEGCWPIGTTLVAYRATDSADFTFENAVPMPLVTWPALVNGGGAVLLRNASGQIIDAMPYASESLGGGGRPVMRSDTRHCGAAANQHLWEPGMNPYHHPQPHLNPGALEQALSAALEEASTAERLVSRGTGRLDWYLGMVPDPVAMWAAEARVGGLPAMLEWRADSVAHIQWDERLEGMTSLPNQGLPISVGPISGCFDTGQTDHFRTVYWPVRSVGEVSVVGALADPVSTDPRMPHESIAVLNRSGYPIGLGSWSFDGALLRRQTVLPNDSVVWLNSRDFEEWPGMANDGGQMTMTLPHGSTAAGLAWSPCDHDAPGFSGSGVPLFRSGSPGSAWYSAGGHAAEAQEPIAIKGFGCRQDPWAGQDRLELYLNRYLSQLGKVEWHIDGHAVPAFWNAVPGRPDVVSLWWEGMDAELYADGAFTVSMEHEGVEESHIEVQCPQAWVAGVAPCLRVVELLWNASADGDEFAEVENCGTLPIDLSGLQATTEAVPLPSDWVTWVAAEASLVLAPGQVAAFGRCPKWMAAGFPDSGPARWSADRWAPLSDAGGTLMIRLPPFGPEVLDDVKWGPELEGPWWWTEDGWAWERSGMGAEDWSPAHGRGSPGAPFSPLQGEECGKVEVHQSAASEDLPTMKWALPMAGGTIGLDMVDWPSGALIGRAVFEDVLSVGQWSWTGRAENGRVLPPGDSIWDLKWWVGHCRGRSRFVVRVPGHG